MNINTSLGQLRLLALFEGISYVLFGITMPLKYLLEIREPNLVVGMLHGILFIAYVASALQNAFFYKWSLKSTFLVLLASLVPFGTFVLEAKFLKPLADSQN